MPPEKTEHSIPFKAIMGKWLGTAACFNANENISLKLSSEPGSILTGLHIFPLPSSVLHSTPSVASLCQILDLE